MGGIVLDKRLPHLPALCPACYALCSPEEKRVAVVVLKLIADQPLNDQRFYMPERVPLCQQEKANG